MKQNLISSLSCMWPVVPSEHFQVQRHFLQGTVWMQEGHMRTIVFPQQKFHSFFTSADNHLWCPHKQAQRVLCNCPWDQILNSTKSQKTSATYIGFVTHHEEFASFSDSTTLALSAKIRENVRSFQRVSAFIILFLLPSFILKIGRTPFTCLLRLLHCIF